MAIEVSDARIEQLLYVLVQAANGDYDVRLELTETDDALLEVEAGINALLDALSERRAANEEQEEELLTRTRQLARQRDELILALSTPVIAVWPGVLALPLIGSIDEARAANITSTLLERVAAERATHVILDLTGVADVSAATLTGMLHLIRAVGLLGAACLLSGVRPQLAQQVMAFDEVRAPVRCSPRLADALALVLREKGALRR